MATVPKSQRHISRLTRETLALIMAGGKGSRLHELTDWRAKPSVHFGGQFRLIDFPLSNCINSGIRRVGVLTQYKAHSLITHIQKGWSNFRSDLDEFVEVWPASQRRSENWYSGTADAVYQNFDVIRDMEPEFLLILSGDHVYKMDYGNMLAYHNAIDADLTISCIEVPLEEAAGRYGVVSVDSDYRVTGFAEKPRHPEPLPNRPEYCLASMGNYVFDSQFLYEQLTLDAENPASQHDFGKDVIPSIVGTRKVYAFAFRDTTGQPAYWRDVGTLDSFYESNLDLVSVTPELNLYDRDWPILTFHAQLPPAKFVFDDDDRRGYAVDSVVAGACVISGARIERSLLFPRVFAHSWSHVTNSVVMPQVEIGRHARIDRAIIDRGVNIPEKMEVGIDLVEDKKRGFRVTDKGRVLVTAEMLGQNFRTVR